MSVKHIAKSGANEGKWVTCPAKVECRNKGLHMESTAIAAIARRLGKKVGEVTLHDVTGQGKPSASKVKPQTTTTSEFAKKLSSSTEIPDHSTGVYNVTSPSMSSVANATLPDDDGITPETYSDNFDRVESLMKQDKNWTQAEEEAKSLLKAVKLEENLQKGRLFSDTKYGVLVYDDYNAQDSHTASRKALELYSSNWDQGDASDSSVKLAFGYALTDVFGMNPDSNVPEKWFSRELYDQHRTFFRTAAKSIYQNTQDSLSSDSYRLARLTSHGQLRPVSSFTSKASVMDEYIADNEVTAESESIVVCATVPKERIFAYYGSGYGTVYQSEILVLGAGSKLPSLNNVTAAKVGNPSKHQAAPVASPSVRPTPAVVEHVIEETKKIEPLPVVAPEVVEGNQKNFISRMLGKLFR
jgi:hypothetical protein